MALSIGIVGLPNVGKSTLFNALTKAQNAQAANYPFCTIEPNKATVAVPDKRVDALTAKAKPQKTIHASVDFIDIAGLVRGASKGEGLGNQFLANIRECAAIVEVVRCFEDENITHVDGAVDPLRDIDTIETELLLADIQSVEKRLEKLLKMAKGSKDAKAAAEIMQQLLAALNDGKRHTQRQICDEWYFPRSTVNTLIKECEGEGYLTLHRVEGERREMEIRLTERGKAFAERVLAPVYGAEEELFRGYFSARPCAFLEELEAFGEEMERVFAAREGKKEV